MVDAGGDHACQHLGAGYHQLTTSRWANYHRYRMKKPRIFAPDDLAKIVAHYKSQFIFKMTNDELQKVFAKYTPVPPNLAAMRHVRSLLQGERQKTLQAICDQLSSTLETPPKLRDVITAVEASGYPNASRRTCREVLDMLMEQNAERWENFKLTANVKKIVLDEGDKCMWEALLRTYDLDSPGLASMLLRIFTVVTRTGRVGYLDVPHLAASITEKEMIKYAKGLNFVVPKPRKTNT